MDFVIDLPISTDWKGDNYDSILVIIDRLMKMVYFERVKVTINAPGLAEVIINIVVRYHSLPDIMSWPRDLITSSHLSSSNDILLSPYLLTTLSLPTSHLIFLS